jgi:hypothetical protein
MSQLFNSTTGLSTVFSGADVAVIFGDEYIGECMSFTLGVNREAGPVHVLGRKGPIGFAKGKRGLGGSFVLAQLGYDALLEFIDSVQKDQNRQSIWVRKDEVVLQMSGSATDRSRTPEISSGGQAATAAGAVNIAQSDLWQETKPFYVDQIPPFNITVVGVNEQGDKMGMRVYGVSILNNGMGISIDDINMEQKYTFVATAASRMQKLYY